MSKNKRDTSATAGGDSAVYLSGSGTSTDVHIDSTFGGFTLAEITQALIEQGVLSQ